jgi:hypothetical protein
MDGVTHFHEPRPWGGVVESIKKRGKGERIIGMKTENQASSQWNGMGISSAIMWPREGSQRLLAKGWVSG